MALDFGALIRQLQASQERANLANIQRYQAGLQDITAGYGAAQTAAQQFGTTALRDIETGAARQLGLSEQGLISRGLGGTTIRGAMARGIETERLRGRERVGEQRTMLTGGLAERRGMALSGFRARMADIGPDVGMFANLMAAAQGAARPTPALPGTQQRGAPALGAMASRGLDIWGQPMGGGGAGGGIGGGLDMGGAGGGVTAGRPGTITYGRGGAPTAPGVSSREFPSLQAAAGAPGTAQVPFGGEEIGREARAAEEARGGEAVRPGVPAGSAGEQLRALGYGQLNLYTMSRSAIESMKKKGHWELFMRAQEEAKGGR